MEYDTDYLLFALTDELLSNDFVYVKGNKIVTREVIESYLSSKMSDKDLEDWYSSTDFEPTQGC